MQGCFFTGLFAGSRIVEADKIRRRIKRHIGPGGKVGFKVDRTRQSLERDLPWRRLLMSYSVAFPGARACVTDYGGQTWIIDDRKHDISTGDVHEMQYVETKISMLKSIATAAATDIKP